MRHTEKRKFESFLFVTSDKLLFVCSLWMWFSFMVIGRYFVFKTNKTSKNFIKKKKKTNKNEGVQCREITYELWPKSVESYWQFIGKLLERGGSLINVVMLCIPMVYRQRVFIFPLVFSLWLQLRNMLPKCDPNSLR